MIQLKSGSFFSQRGFIFFPQKSTFSIMWDFWLTTVSRKHITTAAGELFLSPDYNVRVIYLNLPTIQKAAHARLNFRYILSLERSFFLWLRCWFCSLLWRSCSSPCASSLSSSVSGRRSSFSASCCCRRVNRACCSYDQERECIYVSKSMQK